jgi:hypothetical protein
MGGLYNHEALNGCPLCLLDKEAFINYTQNAYLTPYIFHVQNAGRWVTLRFQDGIYRCGRPGAIEMRRPLSVTTNSDYDIYLFCCSYFLQYIKKQHNFLDFRDVNVSTKSVDSISVLPRSFPLKFGPEPFVPSSSDSFLFRSNANIRWKTNFPIICFCLVWSWGTCLLSWTGQVMWKNEYGGITAAHTPRPSAIYCVTPSDHPPTIPHFEQSSLPYV